MEQHLGSRLAERRRALGCSQSALGEALQVTFQQVQKYERGVNRISASKLYVASVFLGVSVDYFFAGFDDPPLGGERANGRRRRLRSPLPDAAAHRLLTAFNSLSRAEERNSILAFVEAVAGFAAPEELATDCSCGRCSAQAGG